MGLKNITTKYNKTHSRAIGFFILFSLLNIYFLFQTYPFNNHLSSPSFYLILIASFIIEIAACLIIKKSSDKSWPIEKVFLVLGLIVGTLYALVLPIGRAPDEESHFFRAYELSTGHLVSDVAESGSIGSNEASNIEIVRDFKDNNVTYSDLINHSGLYPDDTKQSFITTSAYNYNIFSYLPQVIGLWVGRIIHLPLLATAYLAKLLNMIVCILVLYFSLKYIPIFKDILFFLAFLPITMQAMASFSPDGLVIATATALISFVLYSTYSLKQSFSKKHYFFIFTICLFLSMSKIAYAPLCLLLFAIPKERFKTIKQKYFSIITMGALVLLILILWLILAPSMQSVSDSSVQISTILHNPIRYLAIIIHSLSANASLYLFGLFGGYLEWFDVTLSPLYLFPSIIIFIILCHNSYQKDSITKSFKYLSVLVSLLLVLITFTTMFIQWTKVGEIIIDGVQGRYFLPIILLIPAIFLHTKKPSARKSLPKPAPNYYLYAYLIFESVYAISTLICAHL